ncbi:hypothetical protein CON65_09495 [Bacillus pseudomycoides]|uniref:Uncharacterized protein n=1 Tax=Bacillus pseudomycoides TaxID=64104 RepID=A0AA91VDA5_9BACI|nr:MULTISPECIES: hypothetical protein [Bacillus]PEB48016.1 hypothetical protein COO03_24825 [Bacillus sp. AFS098217]PED82894.1 hypothetical protein CON65_09495 [Bacillus pseudomycoides]PEU09731.1 hypothetical protein CN524_18020 [Bacillus sp. AFS019443]PEU18426.1 hypothetical protein CN525_11820 [Bacillus sp. AFS014408]PFW62670.1 hypothetical protein COL20_12170 [Bacillus sp. AFS075034]
MEALTRLQKMHEITEKLANTKDLDELRSYISQLLVMMNEELMRTNGVSEAMLQQIYEIQRLRDFIEKKGLILEYEMYRNRGSN